MLRAAAVADVQANEIKAGFEGVLAAREHVRRRVASRQAVHRQYRRPRFVGGVAGLQIQLGKNLRIGFSAKKPRFGGPPLFV